MERIVSPGDISYGDQVVINHHTYTVKSTFGPDRIGTYDFYVIDETGRDHLEIVNGAVTLRV
jgi:hypothetical protein